MPNWYAPLTFGERIKRCLSFVNLAIAVLVAVAGVSEFRFDWAERLVGRYLISINADRPEKGGIWEAGRQTLNAHQSLRRIIHEKQETLKDAREADSFTALAERLGPGEWVNLDKARFKALFTVLPSDLRQALIDPVHLIWLLNTDVADRIFCEGRMDGLAVYFIDTDNRVVYQLDLDKKALEGSSDTSAPGVSLDEGIFGRILPADRFFNALFQLPGDMVAELVGDAGPLLKQDGTLTRVGIGDTADNGYIRLGFEFVRLDEVRVVQIQAREWAVWQLNLVLKGADQ